ncbi:MAG TPA: hypothetical protein DD400_01485 [Rhodospirillaceae bacterium]|nr:hypothetical protein [Rhodospirillaceae bacterium]
MDKTSLPLPLAKIMLHLMPRPLLARSVALVVQRMERQHPALFKNVAQLEPATLHLKPTNIPHHFALRTGENPDFTLLENEREQADACISGSLESLIDMLEGRADGDTLFFARELHITGDTALIVALRNTLDREEIDLYQEILSLCGPFRKPVSMGLAVTDHALEKIKEHMATAHEELHRSQKKAGER